MNTFTRRFLSLVLVTLLTACTTLPEVEPSIVKTLAPSGHLKVGVYRGSPTSMVIDAKTGKQVGVAKSLGETLAKKLRVPVQIVEFERLALVLEALKVGDIDFTFTNATAARARDVDFTAPLIQLELGYLVPFESSIKAIADVDKYGVRVGVAQGSSSQSALGNKTTGLQNASLVMTPSISAAQTMLREKKLETFATNKAILFEMTTDLPNFHVLDGHWGLENMAIAVPKGRALAAQYLQGFVQELRSSGLLNEIIFQSGLKGTIK